MPHDIYMPDPMAPACVPQSQRDAEAKALAPPAGLTRWCSIETEGLSTKTTSHLTSFHEQKMGIIIIIDLS
jgi:hypothetical protein